jgi:hypothetical protein
MSEIVQRSARIMNSALKAIKTNPKYQSKPYGPSQWVEERFVYMPINKVPHINVGYHQMDYDIDVMRINQIDNIDKMFSGQKSFLEKYGMYMMLGLLIVAIIVIAYLSFEYMRDVITQNLKQTDAVVNAIKNLNMLGGGGGGGSVS